MWNKLKLNHMHFVWNTATWNIVWLWEVKSLCCHLKKLCNLCLEMGQRPQVGITKTKPPLEAPFLFPQSDVNWVCIVYWKPFWFAKNLNMQSEIKHMIWLICRASWLMMAWEKRATGVSFTNRDQLRIGHWWLITYKFLSDIKLLIYALNLFN